MRKTIFSIAAMASIIAGCAKPVESTKNDAEKKFFDSWILINHPDAQKTTLGSYILESQEGSGSAAGTASQNPHVRLNYTIRDLDGKVSSTSDMKMAQQLGKYVDSNYYGPQVMSRKEGTVATGLEELLESMKVGGKMKAAVPGWLTGSKVYGSAEEYLRNASGTNAIYELELVEAISDVKKWEVDSLVRYMQANYPEVNPADTASTEEYNGKKYGFYYILQKATDHPDSTYTDGTRVYLNYTGRLLNGQVFDTTIEKTAKDAGIYSAGNTYAPTYVTWKNSYNDLTLGSSESKVIDGFKFALFRMKPHEKGTAIFYSAYGYEDSGSGEKIPAYSPLIFEFELVDDK